MRLTHAARKWGNHECILACMKTPRRQEQPGGCRLEAWAKLGRRSSAGVDLRRMGLHPSLDGFYFMVYLGMCSTSVEKVDRQLYTVLCTAYKVQGTGVCT